MTFADTWLLYGLLPVYAIWAWFFITHRLRVKQLLSITYPSIRAIRQLPATRSFKIRYFIQASRMITVALLLLALLNPQTQHGKGRLWSEGVDIMLAIDTSGSMQALDMDPDIAILQRRSRLQVVKEVIQAFVTERPDDQLGIVVFGGQAYTQCPLTLDHSMINTFLDRVKIGMAGDNTAIGIGLATAIKRLNKSPAKTKIVVLLTDGSNNAGNIAPQAAAQIAKTYGIKVYTIGVGGRGPAPFLVDSVFGKQVQYADVDLDEDVLKNIANTTGGSYFRATDGKALGLIYGQIDRMEKTALHKLYIHDIEAHYAIFVVLGLVLLLIEIILLQTRFVKVP